MKLRVLAGLVVAGALAVAPGIAMARDVGRDTAPGTVYHYYDPFYSGWGNTDPAHPFNDYIAPQYRQAVPAGAVTASVQQKLTQLGYYHGPINGVNGRTTQRAVRAFQATDKLPATGHLDSATLNALQIS
jgi:N-acetyl-anhydromuramyl-L-alanine amidase AmpD